MLAAGQVTVGAFPATAALSVSPAAGAAEYVPPAQPIKLPQQPVRCGRLGLGGPGGERIGQPPNQRRCRPVHVVGLVGVRTGLDLVSVLPRLLYQPLVGTLAGG